MSEDIEVTNAAPSKMPFKSIDSEAFREYRFPGGDTVRIDNPISINISASGGHRVYDGQGYSHYIPSGWIHIMWKSKEGRAAFDF